MPTVHTFLALYQQAVGMRPKAEALSSYIAVRAPEISGRPALPDAPVCSLAAHDAIQSFCRRRAPATRACSAVPHAVLAAYVRDPVRRLKICFGTGAVHPGLQCAVLSPVHDRSRGCAAGPGLGAGPVSHRAAVQRLRLLRACIARLPGRAARAAPCWLQCGRPLRSLPAREGQIP